MEEPARRLEEPLENHPVFKKVRDLNSGAFGFVQLAEHKNTGEKVAIKFLLRGSKIDRNVQREILNHRKLLHQHVVRFKGVFLTRCYLGIMLEYVPGCDLLTYIQQKKGITEDVGRWFFQQLIIGLDYIHQMGVANRDIKLENTLLDDRTWPLVKICDFGYSKGDVDSIPKSFVGTRPYLAPEVVSCIKGNPYDGKKADIWSCGVVLYVMLVGAYPFDRPEDPKEVDSQVMLSRIMNVDYDVPPGVISKQCEDLIRKILQKDPTKRPTIAEIQQDPWYQKNLPVGATAMNNTLIRQPDEELQSENEILRILQQARVPLDLFD